ncbi:MAG: ligase-associated DNA damage response endonuclease PdeM [Variibacter sp.]
MRAAPAERAIPAAGETDRCLRIAGLSLVADAAGAFYWPEERLLAVADLHLEKGSSFARRGSLVPPYDTADTLSRLSALVRRYAPQAVVALGDSFHDQQGSERLSLADRMTLGQLMRGRDWVWITGNHDPEPMHALGGLFTAAFARGPLLFRHEPTHNGRDGEIAGHLHPVAQVDMGGRYLRRRCFASDGRRMVMPAFGAYAGGLNVRHRAFAGLFAGDDFVAHVLGHAAVHAFAGAHCLPD